MVAPDNAPSPGPKPRGRQDGSGYSRKAEVSRGDPPTATALRCTTVTSEISGIAKGTAWLRSSRRSHDGPFLHPHSTLWSRAGVLRASVRVGQRAGGANDSETLEVGR